MAEEQRSLRMVWLLGLLILIGSIGGSAYVWGPWSSSSEPTTHPTNPEMQPIVAQGHVDVRGGVISIFPMQPGRVVKLDATEGQKVRRGEPIIHLDDTLACFRVDEAKAACKAVQTQLELTRQQEGQYPTKLRQQQAAVAIAEQKQRGAEAVYQRQKKLHEQKNLADELLQVAAAERDGAIALVDAEKARLDELKLHSQDAQLGVQRVQAELDMARTRLGQAELACRECVIRAPEDGKVLRIQVGVGDMMATQALQPAVSFCPDKPLIIRAEVDQEDAGRIKEGDEAIVVDDTGARHLNWRGKVTYVSDWLARRRSMLLEPGQLNDVRTLECIIELAPDSTGLRIGQRVRVEIPARNDKPE